jgi:uncharacterized repeat protein (TIGR03803 family)
MFSAVGEAHLPGKRIWLAGLLAALIPFGTASARQFSALHHFSVADGANPEAALTVDASGALYGTTVYGGAAGAGTAFRLAVDGTLSTLHNFSPSEGGPSGQLLREGHGRFLGLTAFGNSPSGTVFELAKNGSLKRLHSFGDDAVGYWPRGNLIADSQGNLYGTTVLGGANGQGTIFKLTPDGIAVPLYAFSRSDGFNPQGYLLNDAAGNLYGTTSETNFQWLGSVFRLAPDGTFTKLHQFTNGADGGIPGGALTMDAGGNLYGTTSYGGANLSGVLFKLAPDGTETVLHDFSKSDGIPAGGLTADAAGNLYGTALGGGGFGCRGQGCGTIFVRMATGKFKVIHHFRQRNGAGPNEPLTMDSLGIFYGTATYGGIHGSGVVFKLER